MKKQKQQFQLHTLLLVTIAFAVAMAVSQTAGYITGFLFAILLSGLIWLHFYAAKQWKVWRLPLSCLLVVMIWAVSINLIYENQICTRCRSSVRQFRVVVLGMEIWKDRSEEPSLMQHILHDVEFGCAHLTTREVDTHHYSGLLIPRFSRHVDTPFEADFKLPYTSEMREGVRKEFAENPAFSQQLNDAIDMDHALNGVRYDKFFEQVHQAVKKHHLKKQTQ